MNINIFLEDNICTTLKPVVYCIVFYLNMTGLTGVQVEDDVGCTECLCKY